MKRREFIAGLGSAVAWPAVAPAQPGLPVIGYLEPGSFGTRPDAKAAVHRGLSETGYIEGQNLTVEYRWAEDRFDRLPALSGDLVRRQVRVIVAISTPTAVAAKAATQTIPIVFAIGADPVKIGLVASLNRPDSNLTGIYNLGTAVVAKRLELLHQLVPAAASIAYLVNPTDRVFAEAQTREMQVAARALGLALLIVNASEESEFEAAFATIVRERAGGLVVAGGALASSHVDQLAALGTRHRVPTMYVDRKHTAAGGLVSYGTDLPDTWRRAGVYAGRILKGEKPTDLPVQQVTKIELVINLKTAKSLGLTIPETLLATADEVIQ
jgi:putative ABC transport system substrate-binding protein